MPFDGFGAPYGDHYPNVQSWPRTETTPAELYVSCACGEWSFESQENIAHGIESWRDEWNDHMDEVNR